MAEHQPTIPRDKLVGHVAANPGPTWDVLVAQDQEIERLRAAADGLLRAQTRLAFVLGAVAVALPALVWRLING